MSASPVELPKSGDEREVPVTTTKEQLRQQKNEIAGADKTVNLVGERATAGENMKAQLDELRKKIEAASREDPEGNLTQRSA